MIINNELINKIKDYFSLNIYETKVWLALLQKGVASAGEIADLSRVPRSRTYDVLEGLEKKGFALVKLGKPVKYIGVKPKRVLERLKKQTFEEAQNKVNVLSELKSTNEFEQLEELYTKGLDPVKKENITFSLKGKTSISTHLKEVLNNAQKEVIICTNTEDISSKAKLFNNTLEKLRKAGIDVKIALSGDERIINDLSKRFGIKIKKIDISAKFFIIDRSQILFYLSKGDSEEDTAVWLNSEFFSSAFSGLFDKALQKGKN